MLAAAVHSDIPVMLILELNYSLMFLLHVTFLDNRTTQRAKETVQLMYQETSQLHACTDARN